jgi:hypothetical protein
MKPHFQVGRVRESATNQAIRIPLRASGSRHWRLENLADKDQKILNTRYNDPDNALRQDPGERRKAHGLDGWGCPGGALEVKA